MSVFAIVMSADHAPYVSRRQACTETWIKQAPEWCSVTCATGKSLKTGDQHEDTSERLKKACQFSLGMGKKWDWFLKLDDDVVVIWQSLKLPPASSHYHGYEVPGPGLGIPGEKYVAGAAMWLSRKATEILSVELKPTWALPDDKQAGEILRKYGITPTFANYHVVVRRAGREEISAHDVQRLRQEGLALEVGSPENIRKLHSEAIKSPSSKAPGPVVFTMGCGNEVATGPAVYNPDRQPIDTPNISRPQRDPRWSGL